MNAQRVRSGLIPVVSSLLAAAVALLLGGVFLWVRGKDPIQVYRLMIERGPGTDYGLSESAIKMAPLLIIGAGLIIALRAGVWNIGIDGQFLLGAFLTGVITPALLDSLGRPIALAVGLIAGVIGGFLWALVPALLRAWFSLNEIITTLMLNYLAFNVTAWLVKGPARDASVVAPQTRVVPVADRLPDIPGTDVHIGLLFGLIAVAVVAVLFRRTVPGYRFDVLGHNRRAALYAGYPVKRMTAVALLASGAMAGLAGASDVLGVHGVFKGNWNPGYGFAVFAIAYLARLKPLALVPAAAFLAVLTIGGELASRPAETPVSFVSLLEGLLLLCLAVAAALERRRRRVTAPPVVPAEATP
jgi:simple sugar transport system permease protein